MKYKGLVSAIAFGLTTLGTFTAIIVIFQSRRLSWPVKNVSIWLITLTFFLLWSWFLWSQKIKQFFMRRFARNDNRNQRNQEGSDQNIERGLEGFKLSCRNNEKLIITSDNSECVICRESFQDSFRTKLVASLPNCGHFYHNDCIGRWLFHQLDIEQETSCPVCRSPVLLSVRQNIAEIQIINPNDIVLNLNEDSDSIYKISCSTNSASIENQPSTSSLQSIDPNQSKSETNDLPNNQDINANNEYPKCLNIEELAKNHQK